jgi:type IV secretion system protein TrbL
MAGGMSAVGQAAGSAAMSPLRRAASALRDSFREGGRAAVTGTGGTISGGSAPASPAASGPPAWAQAMRQRQAVAHGATLAAHTLRGGDGGGAGASVDVSSKD